MIIKISPKIIQVHKKFQGICKKPYYGHSKGCPNYGKRKDCPPNLPLLDEIFDFEKDIYLIYTIFPIGEFAEKMKNNHPEWSKHSRQWYNPRLWQGTARKEHKQELEKFAEEHPKFNIEKNPEAYGTNITALMKTQGINLNWSWPPKHDLKNITYRISLSGHLKFLFYYILLIICII